LWIQNRESQSHDAPELQKLNAQNVLVTEASCNAAEWQLFPKEYCWTQNRESLMQPSYKN
jgi:hypothetical protein